MPRQTSIEVGVTATQLTDANVTAITFQNTGGNALYVYATNGVTPPSVASLDGWVKYLPGQGERNVALADLFPGIASANRVWAVALAPGVDCLVSHA